MAPISRQSVFMVWKPRVARPTDHAATDGWWMLTSTRSLSSSLKCQQQMVSGWHCALFTGARLITRFLRHVAGWLDTRPSRHGRQWSVRDGGDVHHQWDEAGVIRKASSFGMRFSPPVTHASQQVAVADPVRWKFSQRKLPQNQRHDRYFLVVRPKHETACVYLQRWDFQSIGRWWCGSSWVKPYLLWSKPALSEEVVSHLTKQQI